MVSNVNRSLNQSIDQIFNDLRICRIMSSYIRQVCVCLRVSSFVRSTGKRWNMKYGPGRFGLGGNEDKSSEP